MTARRVYIILSANALPYASQCIATLLDNCAERIDLTLITDGPQDKEAIANVVETIPKPEGTTWCIADKAEADERAADIFAHHKNLAEFRNGHPCWRKITDPLLFAPWAEESIVLDPDLYFPNRFTFEPTPANGVYLMHQGPNCLYPPEAVERAFEIPVRLANHVDIGVGQWRAAGADMDWLDWFIGKMNVRDFTAFMHIEAIVWSALAMRVGGGYLNPSAWHCWQRGQIKRLLIAAGINGASLLRIEPLDRIKCIHVSGPSKWWVVDAAKKGALKDFGGAYETPTVMLPFIELTRKRYKAERAGKDLLRKLGYYKLTKSG